MSSSYVFSAFSTILLLTALFYNEVISLSCADADSCDVCHNIEGCVWCSIDNAYECSGRESCPDQAGVSLVHTPLTEKTQISIAKATVNLYAGDTESFQVAVQRSANPPLDSYLLMDLSFSLRDDLNTLQSVSKSLVDAFHNFSTNSLIGLGTFVDKTTSPYVSEFTLRSPFVADGQPSSCSTSTVCAPPFSYTHNVDLTNISSIFANGTDALVISTNADTPEGTFDAISQAVLCKDIVGWRDNSVKFLIVITDATVHMAGDGRLAGILKQSPRECKTVYNPNKDVYTYEDSAEYDYPSVEEIRELLEDTFVTPIFATTDAVQAYYEKMIEFFEGVRAQAVTIGAGSSDLITASLSAIENVISSVELQYDTGGNEVSISVSAICPSGTTANVDGMSCQDVQPDDTVLLDINVTLNQCTEELQSTPRYITASIPGYGQFEIIINAFCNCI